MPCANVLTVRWGLIALTAWLLAGPSSAEPVVRQYRFREDSDTGRLVRVGVRVRESSKSASTSAHAAAPGLTVVQGRSSRGVDLDALVRREGERHGVDPDLIFAVIRQESAFDPYAVSVAGAVGLMQLMPETAKRFGVKDILDPAENVSGGVQYLRLLMERYEGDHRLALAAYNAGEGAVDRYEGIPPYSETRGYVKRITSNYRPVQAVTEDGESEAEVEIARIALVEAPDGSLRFESVSN